jgi:hypothetical protein
MQRQDLLDEFIDDFGDAPESIYQFEPTSFAMETRLNPNKVYYSAVGIFEANDFSLRYRFMGKGLNDGEAERGRVYQKHSPNGRLYILYYPGKDNNHPYHLNDTTEPLNTIVNAFDEKILTEFGKSALEHAKKIFIVGESNTYLGFSVEHYIKASSINNILTTEDSIDRDYDESYITNLIPHTKRNAIKHGWQNMITDHWSCGHYVINAIERDIIGKPAPPAFSIDEDILKKHSEYYDIGLNASKEPSYSNTEKIVLNHFSLHNNLNLIDDDSKQPLVMIPVSGKIGFYAQDCSISVTAFENALQQYDENLEIIPTQIDHQITYKVYTNKNIRAFENIGLRKNQDDNGFSFYALNITRQRPTPTTPLFGINISVDNAIRSIDISALLTTNEIKKFTTETENNRDEEQPEQHLDQASRNILQSMQATNRYLTTRAKETYGFWGSLTGAFSGNDYYKRRNSWKKILEKFNAHCGDAEAVTRQHLIEWIQREANKFKPGFFSFFQRTQYYHHLRNLLNTLAQHNDDLTVLQQPVASYYQMYLQMDKNRRLAQEYIQHFSLFAPKDDHSSKTREKNRALYEAKYSLLADKNDFLTTKEEYKAEYKNTTYHTCF